jgi:hypothetical protein
MSDTTALAVVEPGPLMPMSMGTTFSAYTSMQKEIDKAMPDQIMTIQGRQFRKKGYWRAVRAAFSLKVECVREERIQHGDDWGYSVLYRAESRNGMSADGDGVCMSVEKRGAACTEHNVRSHAHTRAFNRAVSNLVGFGEVSAEEVERDDHPVTVTATVVPPPAPKPAPRVAPDDHIPFDDAPDDNSPIPEDAPAAGFTTVLSVKEAKKGEGKNGPWTLYVVSFTDGRSGSTFDGQMAITAKAAAASKTPILPTLVPSGKGTNSMNLTSLVRA